MHRLASFFAGRNGPDALSKATSFLACLLLIVSMFLPSPASEILWLLALVCLVLSYFRMLSRNLSARRRENERFLQFLAPLSRKLKQWRLRRRQRNIYSFFKCPSCGTVLRVPKGKGRIRITCKNCSTVFEKNT